jgi:hypothetical protein
MENEIQQAIEKLSTRIESVLEAQIPKSYYRQSESIKGLAAALIKVQAEMEDPLKSADNPFFNSKYADLAAVRAALRKPLADNGIAYFQFAHADNEHVVEKTVTRKDAAGQKYTQKVFAPLVTVVTRLVHAESGEWVEMALTMPPSDDTPQGIGSCITYGRRYGLKTVVGMADEDDDGNAASGRQESSKDSQKQAPAKKGFTKPTGADQKQQEDPKDIKDPSGRIRWIGAKSCFDETIQSEKECINTAQYKDLMAAVQSKLGKSTRQFATWLSGVYSVEFYDIKNDMLVGIMETVKKRPQEIMNFHATK